MFNDRKNESGAESKKTPKTSKPPVDFDAKRRVQPTNVGLVHTPDVHKKIFFQFLANDIKALTALSKSSVQLNYFFQPALHQLRLKELLQAVVDYEREKVKEILNSNPRLLLMKP